MRLPLRNLESTSPTSRSPRDTEREDSADEDRVNDCDRRGSRPKRRLRGVLFHARHGLARAILSPAPEGLTRTDISVRLSYYMSIVGLGERRAELVLFEGKNRTLASTVGLVRKNSAPDTYPR